MRRIDFSGVAASPPDPTKKLGEFVSGWIERRRLTHRSWDTDASRIRSYLQPSPLWQTAIAEISPALIAGFLSALSAAGLAPSTVKRTYSLLSVIFRDAAVRGHIGQTPCVLGSEHFPRSRQMRSRPRIITINAAARLISSVPISRGALYMCALLTGARVGEIAGLRWADYARTRLPLACLSVCRQFHTKHNRIEDTTKTSTPKFLPVHPSLARALAAWRLQWASVSGFHPFPRSPIFITAIKRQHWRTDSLRNVFKRDLRRAGLDPHHTPHDFRHSFISHAIAAGADRAVVRKITHPSPRDVIDVYTHYTWSQLCSAVSAIHMPQVKHAG